MTTTESVICYLCRREASVKDLELRDGEIIERWVHDDDDIDHPPIPVPAQDPVCCDLCGHPLATRRWRFGEDEDDGCLVCEPCHLFIDRGEWAAIESRALLLLAMVSLDLAATSRDQINDIHAMFRCRWVGHSGVLEGT